MIGILLTVTETITINAITYRPIGQAQIKRIEIVINIIINQTSVLTHRATNQRFVLNLVTRPITMMGTAAHNIMITTTATNKIIDV